VVVIKVREQSSNVLLTMAWSMLWGSAAGGAVGDRQRPAVRLAHHGQRYWGGLLYLSLFGSVIAFAAYFTLIHRIGSDKAVYIGVVTPVISVLLSIQLEHFRPGAIEWAGHAIVPVQRRLGAQTDSSSASTRSRTLMSTMNLTSARPARTTSPPFSA
jgi:drug/metabolite transporter (DMT)-like permease